MLCRAISVFLLAGCCAFMAPSHSQAATYLSGQSLSPGKPVQGDAFLVGSTLNVTKPVSGELFAAGQTLAITGVLGRSSFLAGSSVSLGGSGYDAFVVGSKVAISGTYGNDVYLVGSKITVDKGTIIHGNLLVAGSAVTISGTVDGSIDVRGGSLNLANAHVTGDLTYETSSMATGLASAHVKGIVTRLPETTSQPRSSGVLSWIIALFTTLLTAGILWSLTPRLVAGILETAWHQQARSFLVGIAVFISLPIMAVVLAATVIGGKIAILLGAIYVIFLTVASTLGVFVAGRLILERLAPAHRDHPWGQIIVGSVFLYLLRLIPIVGSLTDAILFFVLFLPLLGAQATFFSQQAA
jgi:hypothetical protein